MCTPDKNYSLESEVAITLRYQLCSPLLYSTINEEVGKAPPINPVTMKNTDDSQATTTRD